MAQRGPLNLYPNSPRAGSCVFLYIRVCKNVHFVTKSRPRVSKNTKKCIILMILFTKFRTGSLDHMRRVSNVVLRKKNNQKMTI